MESSKQSPLTIPVAIIIAGALIAGALFVARGGSGGTVAAGGDDSERGPEGISALFGGKNTPPATPPVQPPAVASLSGVPALDPNKDHLLGNPNADVVILEYSDLECPFCRIFHLTLQRIMNEYGKSGKVAWSYRHFPLAQLHSKALPEAEASECAAELGGNSGFWKFTDRLFSITPSNDGLDASQLPEIAAYAGLSVTEFEKCLAGGAHTVAIQQSYNDAVNAGGRGTPFNVLILRKPVSAGAKQTLLSLLERYRDPQSGNLPIAFSEDGTRLSLSGAMPYEIMKAAIDALLK